LLDVLLDGAQDVFDARACDGLAALPALGAVVKAVHDLPGEQRKVPVVLRFECYMSRLEWIRHVGKQWSGRLIGPGRDHWFTLLLQKFSLPVHFVDEHLSQCFQAFMRLKGSYLENPLVRERVGHL